MTGPFDLNLLVVFDTILAERSVTRAAARLNLSQPAVSGCLARLRDAFGDDLFVRTQGNMVPTSRALALAIPVRQIVARVEGIRELGRAFDPASSQQTFIVSASDYTSHILAPRLLAILDQAAPASAVSFIENARELLPSSLTSGEVTLAIDVFQTHPDELRHSFLLMEHLVVIADASNTALIENGLDPGDHIPLDLFCDTPHAVRATRLLEDGLISRMLASLSRTRNVRMSFSQFSALGRIVTGSQLVACLPSLMAAELAQRYPVRIYRLPRELAMQPYTISMFWHRRNDDSAAHRWLRQAVTDSAAIMQDRQESDAEAAPPPAAARTN